MGEINEFMNTDSLKTIAGCVTAVVVLVNTLNHIFNWQARWFAALLALGLSILVFWTQIINIGNTKDFLLLVMVLVNACLIYTSAFGIQNSVIAIDDEAAKKKDSDVELESAEKKFNWRKKW